MKVILHNLNRISRLWKLRKKIKVKETYKNNNNISLYEI